MAHFVVFIAKKRSRFRVMVREYSSTKSATRGSPSYLWPSVMKAWHLIAGCRVCAGSGPMGGKLEDLSQYNPCCMGCKTHNFELVHIVVHSWLSSCLNCNIY